MNDIVKIENKIIKENSFFIPEKSKKLLVLVNALRLVSQDESIKYRRLIIPDNCEKYGFAEGYHNLSDLLHFLADMIEE